MEFTEIYMKVLQEGSAKKSSEGLCTRDINKENQ
jgi:hypothetical protein